MKLRALTFAVAFRLVYTLGCLMVIETLSSCGRSSQSDLPPPANSEKMSTSRDSEFPRGKMKVPVVEMATAKPEAESDGQMTGRLTWDENYTSYVFSPVFGRVDKIIGQIGQKVSVGGDLAWLRSPDYAQALAAEQSANADLVQAKKNLQRENLLQTKGAAAVQDLESAQASYDQALAEKQRAELWLKQLGAPVGDFSDIYHVRSPIAGMVVDMKINPGQEVRSDIQLAGVADLIKPLFTISDPAHLWVQVAVPEGQLNLMKPGETVTFRTPAYPGKVFTGNLAVVGTSLDSQTRVAYARATVDNSEGLLRAEMYVSVQLSPPKGESVAVEVPSSAVFYQDEKYYVIIQAQLHKFEPREVSIVHEGLAGVSVVVRGIPEGQQIVSDVNRDRPQLVQAGEIVTTASE